MDKSKKLEKIISLNYFNQDNIYRRYKLITVLMFWLLSAGYLSLAWFAFFVVESIPGQIFIISVGILFILLGIIWICIAYKVVLVKNKTFEANTENDIVPLENIVNEELPLVEEESLQIDETVVTTNVEEPIITEETPSSEDEIHQVEIGKEKIVAEKKAPTKKKKVQITNLESKIEADTSVINEVKKTPVTKKKATVKKKTDDKDKVVTKKKAPAKNITEGAKSNPATKKKTTSNSGPKKNGSQKKKTTSSKKEES
ncbi:MAG: hypothetical protein WBO70_01540 [Erysipelotrichaceae bacterium]